MTIKIMHGNCYFDFFSANDDAELFVLAAVIKSIYIYDDRHCPLFWL